jgi:hypothetical protein
MEEVATAASPGDPSLLAVAAGPASPAASEPAAAPAAVPEEAAVGAPEQDEELENEAEDAPVVAKRPAGHKAHGGHP